MVPDEDDVRKLSKEEIIDEYYKVKLSRDRVFTIASHDLRSPFSGLLGISEMLCQESERFSVEDMRAYMKTINESLQNTYNLIENLFEWGRIERRKLDRTMEVIPLKLVLEEVVDSLGKLVSDKQMRIEHDYPEDVLVRTNSGMLEFVLKNFITNAVKFSSRGEKIFVRCVCGEAYDEIQVADNGIGISEENQRKLFRPEVIWKRHGTEGEGGTGLGLLASGRYAEYYDSEIRLESSENAGSVFSLILPANRA